MIGLTLACIAISFVSAIVFMPIVRGIAVRIDMVDKPDRERKLHKQAVALGGGLGVFLAFVVGFVATIYVDRADGEWSLGAITTEWYILFGAAAAILAVGLVDDAITLRGRQKLLLQCLIIIVLVGSGTLIESFSLFGYKISLGVLAFPVTVLWLLLAVNALNLIDGADGMATTAGIIISGGLGFLSLQTGTPLSALVGFALAGSLAGFFLFNRPPASIYLGDAGSMMIGLFVGVLAVWSSFKGSTMLSSAPVAILAIPLFDSTAAIVRRWLTGRSMYTTDRAHLHHLLQAKFGSVGMLFVVAGLCLTTTILGVLSSTWQQPWLAGIGVVLVAMLLVLTRSFGHAECRLILSRAWHFTHSFLMLPEQCDSHKYHRQIPLQGTGRWETIWEPLVEFAKTHELAKINIDMNLAWLHEGYHAAWQSVRQPDKASQLSVRLPLFAPRAGDGEPVVIGRLDIIAPGHDPAVYDRISDLAAKLVDLSPQIEVIVAEIEAKRLALHMRAEPLASDFAQGKVSQESNGYTETNAAGDLPLSPHGVATAEL